MCVYLKVWYLLPLYSDSYPYDYALWLFSLSKLLSATAVFPQSLLSGLLPVILFSPNSKCSQTNPFYSLAFWFSGRATELFKNRNRALNDKNKWDAKIRKNTTISLTNQVNGKISGKNIPCLPSSRQLWCNSRLGKRPEGHPRKCYRSIFCARLLSNWIVNQSLLNGLVSSWENHFEWQPSQWRGWGCELPPILLLWDML